MNRLKLLVGQPKMALGALATLALAASAVIGSGADFNAASANPANTFATGTLSMVNSHAGSAVLTASGLRPGGASTTGDVDIANSGSITGVFSLARGAIADSDAVNPLSAKLSVTVDDCGAFVGATPPVCGDSDDVTKYTGTLADMGTTGHEISSMGTFAAAEKHRYHFTVAVDGSATNAYQGDTSSVQLDWTAG